MYVWDCFVLDVALPQYRTTNCMYELLDSETKVQRFDSTGLCIALPPFCRRCRLRIFGIMFFT